MADYLNLLSSYGITGSTPMLPAAETGALIPVQDSPVIPVTSAKQSAVAVATAAKQQALNGGRAAAPTPTVTDGERIAAMRRTGYGVASADTLDSDMYSLSHHELAAKYGPEGAANILAARASGGQSAYQDLVSQRSGASAVGDTAVGAVSGLLNSVAGLASLGTLPISPRLATGISAGAESATKWAEDNLQSDTLAAKRRLYSVEQALASRDNAQRQVLDVAAGKSPFLAGLERIGRDTTAAIGNTLRSGELIGDVSSNAVGSLLLAGPLTKAVGAGGVALRSAASNGLASGLLRDAGRATAKNLIKGRFVVANGLLEGGGGAQGTLASIAGMSHEDLMQTSPEYSARIASGASPEEARMAIAQRAGLLSAAVSGATGAATSPLVSKFEQAPLKLAGFERAVKSAAGETLEEGIQGATGQLGQNLAIKTYANKNQDMLEGVGEQVGLGALGGFGSAVGVQAPTIAGHGVKVGVKSAASVLMAAASKAAHSSADKLAEANAQAAAAPGVEAARLVPAAAEAAIPAVQAIVAQKGDSLSEEDKAQLTTLTNSINAVRSVSSTALDELAKQIDIPEDLQKTLQGHSDVMSFFRQAARLLGGDESVVTKKDKAAILGPIASMTGALDAGLNANHTVTQHLLENSEPGVRDAIVQFGDVLKTLRNSPDFLAVHTAVRTAAEKEAADAATESATQHSPETTLAMASVLSPDKVPERWLKLIQDAQTSGKLQLTAVQRSHLLSVRSLLQAQRDAAAQAATNGRPSLARNVTADIAVGAADSSKTGKHSLATYANNIYQAYKSGNQTEAKQYLEHLQQFAQHMQNKLGVLNQHAADGTFGKENAKPYQLLHPVSKKMVTSIDKLWLDPTHGGSIWNAQNIHSDTQTVTQVAQDLARAYPSLGVAPVGDSPGLNEQFNNARPDEVKQRFLQKTPTVSQNAPAPAVEPAPQQVAEAPVQQQAVEPAKPAPQKVEERSPEVSVKDQEETPAPAQETKPEPEPKQEQADDREEEQAPHTEDQPADADQSPKTLAERFPKLIGTYDKAAGRMRNWFVDVFKSNPDSTRLSRTEDPAQDLMHALADEKSLSTLIEGPLTVPFNDSVSLAYRYLIGNSVPYLREQMQKQLDAFLDATPKGKGGGKSLRDRLAAGDTPMHAWVNGKALNIVEKGVDGAFHYNAQLLDGAILAGLQWFLQANNMGSIPDAEDVAKILDISEVAASSVTSLFTGLDEQEAVVSLGSKIAQYWGVRANRDAPLSFTEGIPNAVAGEVMRALVNAKLVTHSNMTFTDEGRLVSVKTNGVATHEAPLVEREKQGRMVNRVIPLALSELEKAARFTGLGESRNLIDRAMLRDPEQPIYFGDETPPVAKTQMRNPVVRNSPDQLQALKNASATEYNFNVPMLDMYNALGADVIKEYFGGGNYLAEDATKRFNKVDLMSRDGKNAQVIRALEQVTSIHSESVARAEKEGVPLKDVVMRYAFNFSRVGRLQMLGLFNPQSNKLMRELILPTRSVIDVSSAKAAGHDAMMLALGQAFGLKVHRLSQQAVNEKTQAILDALDENGASETVNNWLDSQQKGDPQPLGKSEVAAIFGGLSEAGVPHEVVALHALVDYVRMSRARADGTAHEFETHLYVEADGVSNGPANALMLLTPGAFTLAGLRNMRRCGVTFAGKNGGAPVAYSLDQLIRGTEGVDELNEGSSVDLYGSSGVAFQTRLSRAADVLAERAFPGAEKELVDQYRRLMRVLGEFVGDISVEEIDGGMAVTVSRGLLKNPLTVTVYGSGNKGIAEKLTSTLLEGIYSRMSQAAEEHYSAAADGRDLGNSFDPSVALFGKDRNGNARSPKDAAARLAAFKRDMHALTNKRMGTDWKSGKPQSWLAKAQDMPVPVPDVHNPASFEFSPIALQTLQDNLHAFLVAPFLAPSIRETIGETADAARLIQQAVAVQSVFLREAFLSGVESLIEEKKATTADTGWTPLEFLSQAELDSLLDRLKHLSPLIRTGTQDFYIAARQKSDALGGGVTSGTALNDRFAVSTQITTPDNAGVKAIATINIGTGDGQMVLSIYSKNQNPQSLPVFDGINGRLTHTRQDGVTANRAALDAMFQNPSQFALESYDAFMEMADLSSKLDSAVVTELGKTLGLPKEMQDDRDSVDWGMKFLQLNLAEQARSVEARHAVLQQLHLSGDQMAAAKAPYLHEGSTFWEDLGANDQERLGKLNEMYSEKLAALEKSDTQRTDQVDSKLLEASDVEQLGDTGVFRLVGGEIGAFFRKNSGVLNKATDAVISSLLTGPMLRDTQVLIGTPEQLAKVAQRFGLNVDTLVEAQNKKMQGLTIPDRNMVLLFNSDAKTMAHELVHAATYSVMQAYYADKLDGAEHSHVHEAMVRLETLRDQFFKEGAEALGVNDEVRQQFSTMLQAVEEAQDKYGLAAGMNEFLAYALSMDKLIQMGKNMRVSKLARIVGAIRAALRKLLGRLPAVKDDVFSNLVFNTAVLSQSRIPASNNTAAPDATVLGMQWYGTSDRLQAIDERLDETLRRHLTERRAGMTAVQIVERADKDGEIGRNTSALAAARVESAFHLTPQALHTFRTIVGVMATSIELSTPSVARMQDLFMHFSENFSWQDFLKDPQDTSDQQEVYDAQNKYNTLIGDRGMETDAHGRTTLLPTFIALSMVDDDFRARLENVKLPSKTTLRNSGDSFDDVLRNGANRILEELNSVLTGEGRHQPNVQAAIDTLMARMLEQSQDKKNWFDQLSNIAGPRADAINRSCVSLLEKLGAWVGSASEKLGAKTGNPAIKGVAAAGKLTGALLNAELGAHGAEAVLAAMNKWSADMPTFKRLVVDMVGRTKSNAKMYDMIKGTNAIISQDRQRFREHLPSEIAKQFSEMPGEEQWSAMSSGMARADLASLIRHGTSSADAVALLSDPNKLAGHIAAAENEIKTLDPRRSTRILAKSKQLAVFTQGGEMGNNLLRNADAIAHLLGEPGALSAGKRSPVAGLVDAIDKLVTLRSLDELSDAHKKMLSELAGKEADGMAYTLDYLYGLNETERNKPAHPNAKFNMLKGYIPCEQDNNSSLIVARTSDMAKLLERSFVPLGDYKGSTAENSKETYGYFFAPVSGSTPLNQGVIQNVRPSIGGVDSMNGYSQSIPTAGRITDPVRVAAIKKNLAAEQSTTESLLAVYDAYGEPIAYERTLDPAMLARIEKDTHLASQIGVWRGRQVEEAKAAAINMGAVDELGRMYREALKKASSNEKAFIDVLDPVELAKDPILANVVALLPRQLSVYGINAFGMRDDGKPRFMVRRDLVADVLGYHKASIGDMWSGNSRWSPEVQRTVKDVLTAFGGNKAFSYAVNAERVWQNFVKDSRTLVIVKSGVVPLANMASNVVQLICLGVPLNSIRKGVPQKLSEIEYYSKNVLRHMSLEAKLNTVRGDMIAQRRITSEMKTIEDSFRRLSIWPLIAAGEFTAISDAGISRDDILISSGRIHAYIEKLVDKLPPTLQAAGKYATVAKDTALFQGLQKAVDYGDFVAKAIYYDDLVKRKGMTTEQALAEVTEEFINYDRLPGRARGAMEDNGMAWYFNYKIRAAKVALRMIQRNPFHAFVGSMVPTPDFLGSVGTPLEDNVFSKLFDGQLLNAFGPGQALRSFQMNPYVNLIM